MKPPLKLNAIDQEHLQELYNASGVARDELPYTPVFEQLVQADRLRDLRHPIASTLLARGNCDRAPVLDLPERLLLIELDDTALREDGRDSPYTELGRLLDDPVHSLAARDALYECQG